MPPHRCSDDMAVEQLILPVQCRYGVLQLAHAIPLAGHLGKDKTAQRIYYSGFTGRRSTRMLKNTVTAVKFAKNRLVSVAHEHH